MRIWHEKLIPHLCQKHLCAMWREGLGCYKIIIENRTDLAYWKHPATQEFINSRLELWRRLYLVREEMLNRKYNPKELPEQPSLGQYLELEPKQWQTLDEQIQVLRSKGCKCNLDNL